MYSSFIRLLTLAGFFASIYLIVVRFALPATVGVSPSSLPTEQRWANPEIDATSTPTSSAAVPSKTKVVGNVNPTLPKPKNGVISTMSGFIMLPEEQRECFQVDGEFVDEVSSNIPNKQRRMAQRRKDPIVAKNGGRKEKVNLNSFKSKFLTLKKKVSALQLEVGANEDFILIVRNNLQDPLTALQSTTAGRYMCYGVGPIADNFYDTGIKFESDAMVKMANNYDYTQDLSVNCVAEKTTNGRNSKTVEKRKSNQVVDMSAAKKQKKRQIPTKVCTPGSFLDNLSVESSSGSDSDSSSNDNAVANEKINPGLHVENGRDV